MPTLSMNELTTYRWPLEEDIRRYAAAGYEGIGVWRQKLADYGEEAAVDLIAESGLRVTNLLWAGGFTGSCGRTPEESIQDAIQAIRLAGALGQVASSFILAGETFIFTGRRNGCCRRLISCSSTPPTSKWRSRSNRCTPRAPPIGRF